MFKFLYPERSLEWHFKAALKIKKWIIDTSIVHPWTVMIKNKVYLEWYHTITSRYDDGKNNDKIYKGKIKIADLDYIA
jgi:hypothetical protein